MGSTQHNGSYQTMNEQYDDKILKRQEKSKKIIDSMYVINIQKTCQKCSHFLEPDGTCAFCVHI